MIGKSILHLVRYFIGLDKAETQTSKNERNYLESLAKGKKRVVEIGVFEGVATRLLADKIAESGELFAIDPFISGRLGICWGKLIAKHMVRKNKGKARIEFIEHYSHEAIQMLDGKFDLIFIDGDHSLEGITRDWKDWSPRVLVGGIVALHDTKVPAYNYNVKNLGSYKYFESHIRHDDRFELIEQIDSLSILKKK